MARIALRDRERIEPVAGFAAEDEQAGQGVATRVAFAGDSPIAARWHTLPSGCEVTWQGSARGHVVYVWSGSIEAGGLTLDTGSAVVIEHGGATSIRGGAQGGEVLVFNATESCSTPSEGEGGHVHLLPAAEVPRLDRMSEAAPVGGALFADSRCPTCRLWLHENDLREAGRGAPLHSHSEDEVIVVIRGEIELGKQRHGRGAALFVGRDTLYGFGSGEEGLGFVNFRPGRPTFRAQGSDQDIDEVRYYDALPPLKYREPA